MSIISHTLFCVYKSNYSFYIVQSVASWFIFVVLNPSIVRLSELVSAKSILFAHLKEFLKIGVMCFTASSNDLIASTRGHVSPHMPTFSSINTKYIC